MRTHEQGKMHVTASKVALESEMSLRQGSVAQQLRQIGDEERIRNRKCIESLIRCTHFLVRHHIPHTTNYEGLIELVLDCGAPYLAEFLEKACKNATYRSTTSVVEFVAAISNWIDESLLNRLRKAPYYSVMLDECTDITVVEEMSVFFRWTENGEPVEHFFDVLPLKKTNAESITTVLMDYLVQKELSLSCLVGMGFDGAATFSGRTTGVQARIKKHSPFALYVHCHCHLLQLACIQAANQTPGIEHVYTTVSSLWKFFHYSPKRSQSLKEIQSVLNLPELKIIKPSDTRWLSHERSIKAIKASYNALVTTLERIYHESHLPEALGLSKALMKKSTICAIFLLDEALPQVAKLSKALQAVKIDLSDISILVDATLHTLSDCTQPAANWVLQLIDACDELETDTGVKITTDDIGQFQERVGNCFIDKLKNNVTSRFSTSKEIITAFSIFEPKGVPKLGTTELESYGKDSVKTLISHYGESKTATTLDGKDYVKQPIISEEVVFEWKTYRQYMSQKSSTANVGDLLTNETLVSMCPNLHKLANICLCLPVSTASVERSFS